VISANRLALPAVVLTMAAASVGGWLGVQYGLDHAPTGANLNHLLHNQLRLTDDQRSQLAAMESAYAAERRTLDQQARAANRELASAIVSERDFGPQAEQAIDRFSAARKALRIATVKHIIAMRGVLTAQQARRYDATVRAALSSESP